MPNLPTPRGPLSEALISALRGPVRSIPAAGAAEGDPLAAEDLHLALYCCYELHYRGFDGVDENWEWEPALLGYRRALERCFEQGLLDAVGEPSRTVAPEEMDSALRAIIAADDAPSLSSHVQRTASLEQVLEFVIHRSAYQLKEADPHTWVAPRLTGAPKAALVEIQADEYGGGRPERVHAQLFADAMAGHLAAAEMTSSIPNRRYGNGLRRLGLGHATAYHDEHVVADAVHENIAAVDLAGGLARQDRALGADALFGARALVHVEAAWSRHILGAWEAGVSSLRAPLPERAAQPAGSAP